jgi:hypothetical protein
MANSQGAAEAKEDRIVKPLLGDAQGLSGTGGGSDLIPIRQFVLTVGTQILASLKHGCTPIRSPDSTRSQPHKSCPL